MTATAASFETAIARSQSAVETLLDGVLPRADGPEARVFEAMRYAALAGGKRFRPFLVCERARLFGVHSGSALRVAAAAECVHPYSLVHSDRTSAGAGKRGSLR